MIRFSSRVSLVRIESCASKIRCYVAFNLYFSTRMWKNVFKGGFCDRTFSWWTPPFLIFKASFVWISTFIWLVNRTDVHASLVLHVYHWLALVSSRTDLQEFRSDRGHICIVLHWTSLSFSRWIADLVVCRHVERWAIFPFSTSLLQVLILPVICPIHLPFCWQVLQFQLIRNTPTTGCELYDDFYLVLCIWISSVQQLLILAEKLIWLQQLLYHSQYVFHRGQLTLVSRPLLARKHSFNMTTHIRLRENIILL